MENAPDPVEEEATVPVEPETMAELVYGCTCWTDCRCEEYVGDSP